MRAIPVQRFLASHAGVCRQSFLQSPESGLNIEMPAIVAYSPAVLLPAVIATARTFAFHLFDSDAMLAIEAPMIGMGLLGVTANIGPIDSTPEGLLRTVLMARASDVIFLTHAKKENPSQLYVESLFEFYMTEEGQQILSGQKFQEIDISVLNADVSFVPSV